MGMHWRQSSSITISNCNLSDANGVIVYSGPKPVRPIQHLYIKQPDFNWNHALLLASGDGAGATLSFDQCVIAGNFSTMPTDGMGFPRPFTWTASSF